MLAPATPFAATPRAAHYGDAPLGYGCAIWDAPDPGVPRSHTGERIAERASAKRRATSPQLMTFQMASKNLVFSFWYWR